MRNLMRDLIRNDREAEVSGGGGGGGGGGSTVNSWVEAGYIPRLKGDTYAGNAVVEYKAPAERDLGTGAH